MGDKIPLFRMVRVLAHPRNNTPLFVLQLLVGACGCLCLLVGVIFLVLGQTALIPDNPPPIDTAPYDNFVYDVTFQDGQVINANVSSTTPYRATLMPALPNDTISSLRMCFTVRSNATTGDAQGIVPYPNIQTDDGLIIDACPPSAGGGLGFSAGAIPAIPVCADILVYLDVNSTAMEAESFSLFVVLDTCNPSEDCTCQVLYDLIDDLIWYIVLLLLSTVGTIIICCCCCICGLLCCSCEAILALIYGQAGRGFGGKCAK